MIFYIEYERPTRYRVEIEARNPNLAVEEFWQMESDGDLGDLEVEVDGGRPYGLSMDDGRGKPIVIPT